MQLLFLFLFGGIVCFILYLSYDRHVMDKKKTSSKDELEIDLNKFKDLIETEDTPVTETIEKDEVIVEEDIEVVKFQARRNKNKKDLDDEEII